MISFGPPKCALCGSKEHLWITNKNFILFFCNTECLHKFEQINRCESGWFETIWLDVSGLQKMFLQYDQQFKRIITDPERINLELKLSELNYWKWSIEALVCDNLGIFGTTERSRFIEKQKDLFWKEERRKLRLLEEINNGKKKS